MSARALQLKLPQLQHAVNLFGELFHVQSGMKPPISDINAVVAELSGFVCGMRGGTRAGTRIAAEAFTGSPSQQRSYMQQLVVDGLLVGTPRRARAAAPARNNARGAYAFIVAIFLLMLSYVFTLPGKFVDSINEAVGCNSADNQTFYGQLTEYTSTSAALVVAEAIGGSQFAIGDASRLARLAAAVQPPALPMPSTALALALVPLRAKEAEVAVAGVIYRCAMVALAGAGVVLAAYIKRRARPPPRSASSTPRASSPHSALSTPRALSPPRSASPMSATYDNPVFEALRSPSPQAAAAFYHGRPPVYNNRLFEPDERVTTTGGARRRRR
jgi:hypothetical protein